MTDQATGAADSTQTSYTYGNDVHGSVTQLLDENGGVKASYGYDAYGRQDSKDGDTAGLTTGDTNDLKPFNPYRYAGKRLDSGTAGTGRDAQMLDMGARRYGLDTGRFLQRDMYADALGDLGLSLDPLTQNRYALAGGNPVSNIELDGHINTEDGGGGATTAGGTSTSTQTTSETSGGTSDHEGQVGLTQSTTTTTGTPQRGQQYTSRSGRSERPAAPHPDRFFEMARCSGGPGCVMPEGYVGKYGRYVHPGSPWELLWLASFIPGGAIARGLGLAAKTSLTAGRAASATKPAAEAAAETGAESSLPKLTGTIAESFDHGEYSVVRFKAGQRFYRAEAWSASKPGRFLGMERADTAASAEQAYNIARWNNPAQVMRTCELTEDVTMYFGRVARGEGYQALILSGTDPASVLRFVSASAM
jgi:RHS repeat-associated protein